MHLRLLLLLLSVLILSLPALAADGWENYSNPRFGFTAAVPPGFALVQEGDNGDGATFRSQDGRAEMLLFGANIIEGNFSDEIRQRIGWDRQEGWTISYDKVTSNWASYSGTREADILYVRGIMLCDGSAGYFHLRYPQDMQTTIGPVISRMVKSLHPAGGCEQSPKAAPGAAQN